MEADIPSPASPEAIAATFDKVRRAWRRVAARAPEAVQRRVAEAEAEVAALGASETNLSARIGLAKRVEDLHLELRGQVPFDPQFYRDGRLAIVRVHEPVRIRGAIDHRRLEAFFERYTRRAEEAYARMLYFFKRAGIDVAEEERERAPWEMPYADLEEYRELIWGRLKRGET